MVKFQNRYSDSIEQGIYYLTTFPVALSFLTLGVDFGLTAPFVVLIMPYPSLYLPCLLTIQCFRYVYPLTALGS